ncbi:hypothetical protein Sme01_08340 [Sphaerisporangium melleum]|uniref:DUF397 domain-containing protein n=1 Tax=Sphaerisporangium melleum TaxID=321316 RepID=A0A917QWK8_9ACTN|nr:hypothetical protein GCM10007964_13850 [Sphaerisporangium melleum]GII68358.1 hypothetical protein Sme01_08340 [Sphaerisporangium melleum]
MDVSHVVWRKSSYSGDGPNCLQVASAWEEASADLRDHLGVLLIRDSKVTGGPVLTVGPCAWAAFRAGVQSGAFGDPV